MRNISDVIKRLISISKEIIGEFGLLATISYRDEENTKEFDNEIAKTVQLMNTESVIINNLTAEELQQITKLLPLYSDDTLTYERISAIIEEKLNEMGIEDEFGEEEKPQALDNHPEIYDEKDPCAYFIIDEESEEYDSEFANYINIFALKRLKDRIMNTECNCENDVKYKQNLLKNLRIFKYLVLSQNLQMERIGLKYRFDVSKMPYLESPNIDASIIAYNHCVAIIDRMYNPVEIKDEISSTTIDLFNMMCFESYLEHIDFDKLNRLVKLCTELRKASQKPFLGDICYHKVLSKNKN